MNAKSELKNPDNYDKILKYGSEGQTPDKIAELTGETSKAVRDVLHENSWKKEVAESADTAPAQQTPAEQPREMAADDGETLSEDELNGEILKELMEFSEKLSEEDKAANQELLRDFTILMSKLKREVISVNDVYNSDVVKKMFTLEQDVKYRRDNAVKHVTKLQEDFKFFSGICADACEITGIDLPAIMEKYFPETTESATIKDAEFIVETLRNCNYDYEVALVKISDWDILKEYPWLDAEANAYAQVKRKDGSFITDKAKRKEYLENAKIYAGTLNDEKYSPMIEVLANEDITDSKGVQYTLQLRKDASFRQNYISWLLNVIGKDVDITFEEYLTLRSEYQLSDEQIACNGVNILDVFGLDNFNDLVEYIDSNASCGGRTTMQTLFKVFGQKNIADLQDYFDANGITAYGSKSSNSLFSFSLEFDGRELSITDNISDFMSMSKRVCKSVDKTSDVVPINKRSIDAELVDRLQFIMHCAL